MPPLLVSGVIGAKEPTKISSLFYSEKVAREAHPQTRIALAVTAQNEHHAAS
jgi:hypothetical protein